MSNKPEPLILGEPVKQDKTTRLLAFMACFFALVSLLSIVTLAVTEIEIATGMATLLGSAVGYGFSYFQQVMNFHFGSSAGSKKKTEIMGDKD